VQTRHKEGFSCREKPPYIRYKGRPIFSSKNKGLQTVEGIN